MIVPAALYVVVAAGPWRRLGALAVCFLIPVGAYLGWFGASHGEPGFHHVRRRGLLYGRVADFASCRGPEPADYDGRSARRKPPAQRNADFYTWDPRSPPRWTFRPCGRMSRDAVVPRLRPGILHGISQLAYAEAAGRDFLYGSSPAREARAGGIFMRRTCGSTPYIEATTGRLTRRSGQLGYTPPAARRNLASFLTGYGRWFYVPGPVFAAGLVLALAGVITGARPSAGTASQRGAAVHGERGAGPSLRLGRCSPPLTGGTSCRS